MEVCSINEKNANAKKATPTMPRPKLAVLTVLASFSTFNKSCCASWDCDDADKENPITTVIRIIRFIFVQLIFEITIFHFARAVFV